MLTARHCAAGGLCLVAAHQGLPDARELWLEAADPARRGRGALSRGPAGPSAPSSGAPSPPSRAGPATPCSRSCSCWSSRLSCRSGIGPEPALLRAFAPGFIWIAALLATLQSLEALFRRDLEEGTLAQLYLLSSAAWFGCLARLLVHWLSTGLPIVLLTPLLALWLDLPSGAAAAAASARCCSAPRRSP
jgi:hypothetical protein